MGVPAYNAAPPPKGKKLPPILPTGIYTIPEAGTVGQTEQELIAAGTPYVVGRAPYRLNARGRIIGDREGLPRSNREAARSPLHGWRGKLPAVLR